MNYRNTKFRVVISLVASAFILLVAHEWEVIVRAFITPSFYLALLISFPIALLLVYIVHRATIWLDDRHDWRKNLKERLFWQICFAFILPLAIDLGLISIHSAIMGENFSESPFLYLDFPIIGILIILLNVYYVIWYLWKTGVRNDINVSTKSTLTIDYKGIYAELNAKNDVICLYRSVNLIKVVTVGREFVTRGDSINDYEEQLASQGFLRINRSTIVNLNFVQGFGPGQRSGSTMVLFRANLDLSELDSELFEVTEKNLHGLKSHFKDKLS